MIEIKIARHSGFCFGVREAIKKATETASASSLPTKTYGPLIHNPQEIKRLKSNFGIESVEELGEYSGGNLVIRAHGLPPEDYQRATEHSLNIVDATCRFVKDVQDYAVEFCKRGYDLFVVGDERHAEIRGIVGHARFEVPDCKVFVVSDLDEITNNASERTAIVFQTTQEFAKYKRIEQYIKANGLKWKIKNTICGATRSNQYAADELARMVDLMIVVGGKNSGNTKRLAEICERHTKTKHIETADEVVPDWFIGVTEVGITAGASTPQWVIDDVIEIIEQIDKELSYAIKDK
ncbi:MAG: 4-hydroxy-3-methylbut-2-enyl diphosphate reductase [Nitrospirae bacterium]|nr:4-hydroxy-3-methylbut-2-enyl diphosphate reductase [Nitrospirota bacterium]